jgi:hypothetical protein
MATEKLTALITAIRSFQDAGGSVDLIARSQALDLVDIEEALSVRFPESLSEFYTAIEYLRIGGDEFVVAGNLVETTSRLRDSELGLRQQCIPILDDGMGGHYCVICSKRKPRAPKGDVGNVIFWSMEDPSAEEFKASDVFDFIQRLIRRRLDDL